MDYEPQTEEQIKENSGGGFLCAPGDYPFEVHEAREAKSKAGNDMIEVDLTVFDGDRKIFVYDYLVGTKKAAWKLRHFCAAVGLIAPYEAHQLNAHLCQGRTGFVTLKVKPAEGKYKEAMGVVDYVVPETNAAQGASQTAKPAKFPPTEEGLQDGTPTDSIPF